MILKMKKYLGLSLVLLSASILVSCGMKDKPATESVPVHDIWAGEDLDTATGSFSTTVPSHGVKLFRLGDKATTGINNPTTPAVQSSIFNLQSSIYNLQGQRVSADWKGIQIQNGKKRVK